MGHEAFGFPDSIELLFGLGEFDLGEHLLLMALDIGDFLAMIDWWQGVGEFIAKLVHCPLILRRQCLAPGRERDRCRFPCRGGNSCCRKCRDKDAPHERTTASSISPNHIPFLPRCLMYLTPHKDYTGHRN